MNLDSDPARKPPALFLFGMKVRDCDMLVLIMARATLSHTAVHLTANNHFLLHHPP